MSGEREGEGGHGAHPAEHSLSPALWMVTGAFFFAVMSALTYALGSRCDWLLIALVRASFMFGTSLLMARWKGVRLVLWEPRTLWIRSLAGSVSLVCNFFAMTRLPIADVLTLTNTYPLWIVLLSALLLGLPPTVGEITGVISGIVGVALIQQPHLGGDAFAAAVALVGSVSTAVAMLGLHRLRGVDARAIVAHFAGVATCVATVWIVARGRDAIDMTVQDPFVWLMLAGVAACGTIGQFFLTKAYAAGPPGEVAVVGLSQVVFGMGFDVLIWRRAITPATTGGILLVLLPAAWLSARASRKLLRMPRGVSPGEPPEIG